MPETYELPPVVSVAATASLPPIPASSRAYREATRKARSEEKWSGLREARSAALTAVLAEVRNAGWTVTRLRPDDFKTVTVRAPKCPRVGFRLSVPGGVTFAVVLPDGDGYTLRRVLHDGPESLHATATDYVTSARSQGSTDARAHLLGAFLRKYQLCPMPTPPAGVAAAEVPKVPTYDDGYLTPEQYADLRVGDELVSLGRPKHFGPPASWPVGTSAFVVETDPTDGMPLVSRARGGPECWYILSHDGSDSGDVGYRFALVKKAAAPVATSADLAAIGGSSERGAR